MITSKDCKYYKDGQCRFSEHPDCKATCGIPEIDNVHECEMEYPCFDDAIIQDNGEVGKERC